MSKRRKINEIRTFQKGDKLEGFSLHSYQKALGIFLGNAYQERLDEENCKRKVYLGSVAKFVKSEHIRILSISSLKNLMKKEKVNRLREFYFQEFGVCTKLAKRELIRLLIDLYDGKKPARNKRKEEISNIDEDYIKSSTSFFTVSSVLIPGDVMKEIFSYLRHSYSLLRTLGAVNSSFYLLLLTKWDSIVPITSKSLYMISVLILRSMKRFQLGKRLSKNELEYLTSKFTPHRITEIHISENCSTGDISKFFNHLKKKKIKLMYCRHLGFPRMFQSGRDRRRVLCIPSFPFPSLRSIDQYQPNHMRLETKSIQNLHFGDYNCWSSERLNDKRDVFFKTDFKVAGAYKITEYKPQERIEVKFNERMSDLSNILYVRARLQFFQCLLNLKLICESFKNLRVLVIISDTSDMHSLPPEHHILQSLDPASDYIFSNLRKLEKFSYRAVMYDHLFKVDEEVRLINENLRVLELEGASLGIIKSCLSPQIHPNLETASVSVLSDTSEWGPGEVSGILNNLSRLRNFRFEIGCFGVDFIFERKKHVAKIRLISIGAGKVEKIGGREIVQWLKTEMMKTPLPYLVVQMDITMEKIEGFDVGVLIKYLEKDFYVMHRQEDDVSMIFRTELCKIDY